MLSHDTLKEWMLMATAAHLQARRVANEAHTHENALDIERHARDAMSTLATLATAIEAQQQGEPHA